MGGDRRGDGRDRPCVRRLALDLGSWRAIFLINLPLALAALLLALAFVPDDRDDRDEPLDWIGGALATVGLGGVTWALTVGSGRAGWTQSAITGAALGILMLMLFVFAEARRGALAMMPLALFRRLASLG